MTRVIWSWQALYQRLIIVVKKIGQKPQDTPSHWTGPIDRATRDQYILSEQEASVMIV